MAWDLLRAMGGVSNLERGHSSVGSNPEPSLSGLCQGQVFEAEGQRAAGQEELSAFSVFHLCMEDLNCLYIIAWDGASVISSRIFCKVLL